MAENDNIHDDSSDSSPDFEKKVESIDQRVNDALKRVEEKLGKIADEPRKMSRRRWDNSFWGIVLLLVGFFWLGNNLHWFRIHIPVWPIVLIVVGLYLLLDKRND
jgi:apolipoprotein N-acyltransferase